MNNKFKKTWKALKSIRFTADRKELHKRALLRAMRQQEAPRASWWKRFVHGFHGHRQAFAGAMACLVLFSAGGVTYAAEQALPGETLHPVKTMINEEIMDLIHFTEEAQKAWDERRVERRLEEVEALHALEMWTEELEHEVAEFLDETFEDEFLVDFEDDFDDWFEDEFWLDELEEIEEEIEELEEELEYYEDEYDEEELEELYDELDELEEEFEEIEEELEEEYGWEEDWDEEDYDEWEEEEDLEEWEDWDDEEEFEDHI